MRAPGQVDHVAVDARKMRLAAFVELPLGVVRPTMWQGASHRFDSPSS
jgi:hypothetical protein